MAVLTAPPTAPTSGTPFVSPRPPEDDAWVLNATTTAVEATPCITACDSSNGCSTTCPSACTSGS